MRIRSTQSFQALAWRIGSGLRLPGEGTGCIGSPVVCLFVQTPALCSCPVVSPLTQEVVTLLNKAPGLQKEKDPPATQLPSLPPGPGQAVCNEAALLLPHAGAFHIRRLASFPPDPFLFLAQNITLKSFSSQPHNYQPFPFPRLFPGWSCFPLQHVSLPSRPCPLPTVLAHRYSVSFPLPLSPLFPPPATQGLLLHRVSPSQPDPHLKNCRFCSVPALRLSQNGPLSSGGACASLQDHCNTV